MSKVLLSVVAAAATILTGSAASAVFQTATIDGIADMSGRRPVVKGLFEAAVDLSGAVMSAAC